MLPGIFATNYSVLGNENQRQRKTPALDEVHAEIERRGTNGRFIRMGQADKATRIRSSSSGDGGRVGNVVLYSTFSDRIHCSRVLLWRCNRLPCLGLERIGEIDRCGHISSPRERVFLIPIDCIWPRHCFGNVSSGSIYRREVRDLPGLAEPTPSRNSEIRRVV